MNGLRITFCLALCLTLVHGKQQHDKKRYVRVLKEDIRDPSSPYFPSYRSGLRLSTGRVVKKQSLVGPNVCGDTCCKGWYSGDTLACITPICDKPCQNGGRCDMPNICICPSIFTGDDCSKIRKSQSNRGKRKRGPRQTIVHVGYGTRGSRRYGQSTSARMSGVCTPTTCFNGGTCVDGSCICLDKYVGQRCEKVILVQTSLKSVLPGEANIHTESSTEVAFKLCRALCNHGTCQLGGGPICRCHRNYYGAMCESRLAIRNDRHNTSMNPSRLLPGLKYSSNFLRPIVTYRNQISRRIPISTSHAVKYGKCYKRYRGSSCGVAFSGLMTRKSCCDSGLGDAWGNQCTLCTNYASETVDMDQAIQNANVLCPVGFVKIGGICKDIDECLNRNDICRNGECVNSRGSFWCKCNRDFHQHISRSLCIPDAARERSIHSNINRLFEKCYRSLNKYGTCVNAVAVRKGNRAACCCSVGVAWGSTCNKCPRIGTIEHYRLCPRGTGYHRDRTTGTRRYGVGAIRPRIVTSHRRVSTKVYAKHPTLSTNTVELSSRIDLTSTHPSETSKITTTHIPTTLSVNQSTSTKTTSMVRFTSPSPQNDSTSRKSERSFTTSGPQATSLQNQVGDDLHGKETGSAVVVRDHTTVSIKQEISNLPSTNGTKASMKLKNNLTTTTQIVDADRVTHPDDLSEITTNTEITGERTIPPIVVTTKQTDEVATTNLPLMETGSPTTLSNELSTNLNEKELSRTNSTHAKATIGKVQKYSDESITVSTAISTQTTRKNPLISPVIAPENEEVDEYDEDDYAFDEESIWDDVISADIAAEDDLEIEFSDSDDDDYLPLNNDKLNGEQLEVSNDAASTEIRHHSQEIPSTSSTGIKPDNEIDPENVEISQHMNTTEGQEVDVGSEDRNIFLPKEPGLLAGISDLIPMSDGFLSQYRDDFNLFNQSAALFSKEDINLVRKESADNDPPLKLPPIKTNCLPNPCLNDGECVSNGVSFKCQCTEGYFGMKCETKDYCVPDPCQHGATCEAGIEFYYCSCREGYAGINCETDVDDCESLPCKHGRCQDKLGGYKCYCHRGFRGDACEEDIDECKDDPCEENEICENTVGSFRCVLPLICDDGYALSDDGRSCVDIDECLENSLCVGGDCINSEGSFKCLCKSGFIANDDNTFCEESRLPCYSSPNSCTMPLSVNTTEQECCCTIGRLWGACDTKKSCPKFETAMFRQLCPNGRGRSAEMGRFNDLDECSIFTNEKICLNGRCVNKNGGYRCFCYNGFYYNHLRQGCEDVNECGYRNKCIGGYCINTHGSFKCKCPRGSVLRMNGYASTSTSTCTKARSRPFPRPLRKDNEEIQTTRSPFRELCYDTPLQNYGCGSKLMGTFTYKECCCSAGVAWGRSCSKCPERNSNDHRYLCRGFEKSPIRISAANEENTPQGFHEQECGIIGGCGHGKCLRVLDGFACECEVGYQLDPDLMTCTDIDECRDIGDAKLLCMNGFCLNTPGSFRCICKTGFEPSPTDPMMCISGKSDSQYFIDATESLGKS